MKKCLIATHGRLASGFKSSLEILLGSTEGISVIDAYLDETNFEDHLIDYLNAQNNEDQIILMSDLYGGSVKSSDVTICKLKQQNTYSWCEFSFCT